MVEVEICCFSLKSSQNASMNGASRIELCGGFLEGGTSPSYGLVREVLNAVNIPVYIMIRPRGGDFCYSESEQRVIKADIEEFKKLKPSGFVFGALNADGKVDEDLCTQVINWAKPYPITFHRAFDVSVDMNVALETIIQLGFERILTSGGANSVEIGLHKLKELNQLANERIQIMAGAGVNIANIDALIHAGLRAVHTTAKAWEYSNMNFKKGEVSMASGSMPDEFGKYEAKAEIISAFIQKANSR